MHQSLLVVQLKRLCQVLHLLPSSVPTDGVVAFPVFKFWGIYCTHFTGKLYLCYSNAVLDFDWEVWNTRETLFSCRYTAALRMRCWAGANGRPFLLDKSLEDAHWVTSKRKKNRDLIYSVSVVLSIAECFSSDLQVLWLLFKFLLQTLPAHPSTCAAALDFVSSL